jgi:threonine dehydratase
MQLGAEPLPISLEDVRAAHQRIVDHVRRTPAVRCDALDRRLGARVFLKCENLQITGSFKVRGACNFLMSLTEQEAQRGVVTHSSGNHAAAVAWAAGLRGVSARVVMPANSQPNKLRAVRSYGIEPVLCEPTPESRHSTAQRLVEQTGGLLVHPYNDPRTMAGQGTAALELLDEVGELDMVIAPVGGGGLLSGTAVTVRALRPDTRVLAAEPALADDAYRSWQAGRLLEPERFDTVADGLRTSLGSLAFPVLQQLVDDVLLAGEQAIVAATRMFLEDAHLVVEPSGAVPLAALLENGLDVRGLRVGIIISGGNLDLDQVLQAEWPRRAASAE